MNKRLEQEVTVVRKPERANWDSIQGQLTRDRATYDGSPN